jgi:diacylglycerol O-acyltransferase / wax synthase
MPPARAPMGESRVERRRRNFRPRAKDSSAPLPHHPRMQRLSTLDSSFLRVETPTAHMHVGWLAIVNLPEGQDALDVALLRRRVESRLHHAPRFRRCVQQSPVGEPYLLDDPEFDIANHVTVSERRVMQPRELRRLTDAFLSEQLDRDRPLWEIRVVPRVGQGRAALVGKVHHALVDGVAAVELGTLLFDIDPAAAGDQTQPWRPEPAPSPARFALDLVADSAMDQFRAARRMVALGVSPRRTLRAADTMRRAALSLAEEVIQPAPSSFLNRPIGPERALLHRSVPIRRLERAKASLGLKLNDVVLAVMTGALRRYSALADEEPRPLRTMVPVNVRSTADASAEGNRIAFGFVDLPLDEADPLRRVKLIRWQTERLRGPEAVVGRDALMRSVGMLPGPLKTQAARFAASARTFNLTISNVVGPRITLYAAGARVEEIYPVIPLSDAHALAVGVLSYGDFLHFALHVAPRSLVEADALPGLVGDAISELERALPQPLPPAPTRRRETSEPTRPRARSLPSARPRPARSPGARPARPTSP